MPIAVDGRQFIHAPELSFFADERLASRCWSSSGLKVAKREDDLMSSDWRWRFRFSGSDGFVDEHASIQESWACGMLSGSVISDIKNWLAEMEAKYAGTAKSEARRKPMPPSQMGGCLNPSNIVK